MLALQLCLCVVPLLMPLNLSQDSLESGQVSTTELAASWHRLTVLEVDGRDDDDDMKSEHRKDDGADKHHEDKHPHGDRADGKHIDGGRRPQHGRGPGMRDQAHKKSHGPKNPGEHLRGFGARDSHKNGIGHRHGGHHRGPASAFRGRRGPSGGMGNGPGRGFGFGNGRQGFSRGGQHAGPGFPFMRSAHPFHNTRSIAQSFAPIHHPQNMSPQNMHGLSSGPMSGIIFELLDLNQDGNLSREEFQRLPVAVSKSHPHPEQAHGPQAHGPQGHGPQVHGPQVHGPQAHGPQGHGPQAHGPQGHGMLEHGENGRAEGPRDSHAFGPRPPMMHGFRPEHGRPGPEFRRPEMDRPEASEPKDLHRDPSSRGRGPGRDVIEHDKFDQENPNHERSRRDEDHRGRDDQHDKEDQDDDDQSRTDKRAEKPLSDTRSKELPHHVVPFDWI